MVPARFDRVFDVVVVETAIGMILVISVMVFIDI